MATNDFGFIPYLTCGENATYVPECIEEESTEAVVCESTVCNCTVACSASMALTVETDAPSTEIGDVVDITITIENTGAFSITDITLSMDETGDDWSIATLAVNGSYTFDTEITITQGFKTQGYIVLVASAEGTSSDDGSSVTAETTAIVDL